MLKLNRIFWLAMGLTVAAVLSLSTVAAYQQATATPGFGPIITAPPGFTPEPNPPQSTPTPTEPPPAEETAPGVEPTATLEGTPLPTFNADMMGIQIHPDLSQDDFLQRLEQVKRLGVKWVKFQFAWDQLTPEPGVEAELMGRYRLFVQSAYGQGLDVLVSIAKAPDWTRATTEEDGPPTDPQELGAILTRMLQHIDLDMYGFHPVDAIEIWNEPNLRREWNGGTLNGADYMRYFDAAYNAIRAAPGGSAITIVTAGLAPTGINDGVQAVDDRVYLRQMYQAGLNNGVYQNIAIGMHPYSAWNAPDATWCGQGTCSDKGWDNHPSFFFMNTIQDYHAIMQEYGDTTHQLWGTEFGWATFDGLYYSDGSPAAPPDGFQWYTYIDQVQMGNYIIRAYEIARDTSWIGVMFLWNLNFADPYYVDIRDPRAGYAVWGTQPQPERFAFRLLSEAPKTSDGGANP